MTNRCYRTKADFQAGQVLFAVMEFHTAVDIANTDTGLYPATAVPLIFAEGMVGCIPVFETLEDAARFSGDRSLQIMKITLGSL